MIFRKHLNAALRVSTILTVQHFLNVKVQIYFWDSRQTVPVSLCELERGKTCFSSTQWHGVNIPILK